LAAKTALADKKYEDDANKKMPRARIIENLLEAIFVFIEESFLYWLSIAKIPIGVKEK
jgi:hypothetical protein